MKRPLLVMLMNKEIPDGLKNFFSGKQIKCITPDQYNTAMELTHLVVSPQDDLKGITDQFQVVENDIRLLSLGPMADMSSFLESNGRLVVDPKWFKSPMGKIILEKFFEGRASVNLDQNFPAIKEHGGFKVTNHLRMGHDLDRLASFVHARNSALVNVRTFVDHAIYYACYLAQAKIGSTPFDVDYGFTGTDIVVQVHLPVRRFLAENLLSSFHTPNGSDPVKYLLSICAQSADFTEVQYIQEAGKLVLSGLWQSSEAKLLGFSGLLVNHVRSVEQIQRASLAELTSIEVAPPPVVEVTEAEALVEKPLVGEVPNPAWEVEVGPQVNADTPEPRVAEPVAQVIKGSTPEPDASQVIKGSAPEKESSQTIKGSAPEKDSSQTIKGKPEAKDTFQQRFTATKEAKDNFQVKISAGERSAPDNSKQVFSRSAPAAESDDIVSAMDQSRQEQDNSTWAVKSIASGVAASPAAELTVKGLAPGQASALQVKELEAELRKTKSQLELAAKEIKVFKDMRKQMFEVEQKFKQTQQETEPVDNMEAIDAVRAAENEVRKAKLELQQKQVFFAQELEKNQRLLKSREMVIEKAKDSLKLLTEKKDKEIRDLQERMTDMGSGQTAASTAFQQVKTLEAEKQSLARLVDVYKNKLTAMTAKMEREASNPASKDEELRKVQLEKQTAQVALTAAQKEITKLKSRSEIDQNEIKRLADEKIAFEQKYKAATSAAQTQQNNSAEEALKLKNRELERDLAAQTIKASRSDEKVKELEKKILDLTASITKLNSSGDANLKTKVAHLDAAVKKMTQDLTTSANQLAESKKEINKLRQEKTALQNQLDKAKKDADKAAGKDKDSKKAA